MKSEGIKDIVEKEISTAEVIDIINKYSANRGNFYFQKPGKSISREDISLEKICIGDKRLKEFIEDKFSECEEIKKSGFSTKATYSVFVGEGREKHSLYLEARHKGLKKPYRVAKIEFWVTK